MIVMSIIYYLGYHEYERGGPFLPYSIEAWLVGTNRIPTH